MPQGLAGFCYSTVSTARNIATAYDPETTAATGRRDLAESIVSWVKPKAGG